MTVRFTPEVEGAVVFRIEPDCLSVIGNRFVNIALFRICTSADSEGNGVFWIEPNRFRKVADRAIECALLIVRSSTTDECQSPV